MTDEDRIRYEKNETYAANDRHDKLWENVPKYAFAAFTADGIKTREQILDIAHWYNNLSSQEKVFLKLKYS